ncbi:MAG: M56 family metallopeptidase [Aureliella sp.]
MAALIACLLQVSLVAVLTLGVTRWLLPRDARKAEFVCLVGIVLCTMSVLLMCFEVPRAWTLQLHEPVNSLSAKPASHAESMPRTSNASSRIPAAFRINMELALNELRFLSSPRNEFGVRLSKYATWAALACCATILLRLALGYAALWRMTDGSKLCVDPHTLVDLEKLASNAGLETPPEIRFSHRLTSPCVSCLRRSVIYVPVNFSEWTELERRTSLAHELTHVRRNDARRRLFAEIVLSAIYMHPLASWLRSNLIFAQELATDRDAAKLLSSPNQYRQGLSMLALRMDSQHNDSVSFGVSVSTNTVVRRIKMLKSNKSYYRSPSWLMLAGFVIVSTGAIAWNIHADEPQAQVTRIAARGRLSNPASKPFSRATCKPWDAIGQGSGYAYIQPQPMLANKDFASQLTMIESVLLRSTPPEVAQDLVGQLQGWQSSLDVQLTEIPEAQRQNENKYAVSLGSNRFQLDFAKVVDWSAIADTARLQPIFPKEHEAIRELLRSKGQSKTLQLSPETPTKTESNPTAQQLWSLVQGGVLTVAFAVPQEIAVDQEYLQTKDYDGVELIIYELLQVSHSVALGMDIVGDPTDSHFRLAVAVKEADKLEAAERCMKEIQSYISGLEDADNQTEEERSMLAKIRSQANEWKITSNQADSGLPTLTLTGQLPFQALGRL